jgi:hypothetical protein
LLFALTADGEGSGILSVANEEGRIKTYVAQSLLIKRSVGAAKVKNIKLLDLLGQTLEQISSFPTSGYLCPPFFLRLENSLIL